MNLKSGQIDQFKEFSQFVSLEEFNHHLEMWLAEKKVYFSKGELVGLKRLARFSAKIPGVSNAKIGTILKAIHEEYRGNGISRSTFKRMIQKALKIGIFSVYETERKNGSQSSNLYVFNRFPSYEPPKGKTTNHPKTNNLSKTNHIKITKRTEDVVENDVDNKRLDDSYTSDRVPKSFVSLVKCFYGEANVIEEFWRMTRIAAYRNNMENETVIVLDIAIQAFKQLVRKIKASTTRLHKPIAYYYGILNKKLDDHYMEALFEMRAQPVPDELFTFKTQNIINHLSSSISGTTLKPRFCF